MQNPPCRKVPSTRNPVTVGVDFVQRLVVPLVPTATCPRELQVQPGTLLPPARCGRLHSSPVRTGGEARGLTTLRSWLLGFIVPLAFSALLNYRGIPTFTSSDVGSSSAHQSACGGRGISFPCSFRVSAAVLLPHTETKALGVNGASKACWGLA